MAKITAYNFPSTYPRAKTRYRCLPAPRLLVIERLAGIRGVQKWLTDATILSRIRAHANRSLRLPGKRGFEQ